MQQSAHLSSPLHHFPPPTSLHCPPRSLAISPHTFTSSSCSHPLLLSNEWIQHRRLFPPLAGVVQRIQLFSTGSSRHIVKASNEASSAVSKNQVVEPESVSVILLAGGQGKRMGANMPKQYLPLLGQPIALYSFYTFINMVEVKEIIVVCDPSYRDIFEDAAKSKPGKSLKFALPGKERQDSVLSGLKEICDIAKLACVHDSARPLVMTRDIHNVLADAWIHGAAVLGVPVKATIKEADKGKFVVKTLDRRCLWEMQTPQVIEPSLLLRGFELIHQQNLEVTDDVSIVEYLNHPVIITEGSYTNIKVTTPDDMLVAERILHQSGAPVKVS